VRTGWLIGLIPIWSAVLSAAVLQERLGGRKILGLVAGAVGAVLVVTKGEIGRDVLALPSTRGDLLVLASTINWAVYTVLGHRTLKRLGSGRATAASMLLGWLMLTPLFVGTSGWRELSGLSPTAIGCVVFLGVGCSGLGYLFWYAALERLEASRVAAFLYLEPLVTLATAMSLLDETMSRTTLAGGVLVLLGVWTIQRAPRGTTASDAS